MDASNQDSQLIITLLINQQVFIQMDMSLNTQCLVHFLSRSWNVSNSKNLAKSLWCYFAPRPSWKNTMVWCKLSCNRDIFQITFQNYVVRIIFVYRSICFLTPALVEVSYEFSPVRPFFRPSDGNVRSHRWHQFFLIFCMRVPWSKKVTEPDFTKKKLKKPTGQKGPKFKFMRFS